MAYLLFYYNFKSSSEYYKTRLIKHIGTTKVKKLEYIVLDVLH